MTRHVAAAPPATVHVAPFLERAQQPLAARQAKGSPGTAGWRRQQQQRDAGSIQRQPAHADVSRARSQQMRTVLQPRAETTGTTAPSIAQAASAATLTDYSSTPRVRAAAGSVRGVGSLAGGTSGSGTNAILIAPPGESQQDIAVAGQSVAGGSRSSGLALPGGALPLAPLAPQYHRSNGPQGTLLRQHRGRFRILKEQRRPIGRALPCGTAACRPLYGPLPYATPQQRRAERRRWLERHRGVVSVAPVAGDPRARTVLLAATRAAIAALPPEALAAAFDRVNAGISLYEAMGGDSGSDDDADSASDAESSGREVEGDAAAGADGETREGLTAEGLIGPLQDATFLTAVGLGGRLPAGESEAAAADDSGLEPIQPPADSDKGETGKTVTEWEDPTERLARALGLDVSRLAHRRPPGPPRGNAAAAAARLRHAIERPLVDLDAGLRPNQHHTKGTEASEAKRAEAPAVGAASPHMANGGGGAAAAAAAPTAVAALGSVAASTRARLKAFESSMLQQLQDKAKRMEETSQQMQAAAAAAAAAVAPKPQPLLPQGGPLNEPTTTSSLGSVRASSSDSPDP